MITHIVLFRFHEEARDRIEHAQSVLGSLAGRVPHLISLDVGVNVLPSTRAYDLGLVATFASLDDLDGYRAHPDHVAAAGVVDRYCASVVSVDYKS